MVIIEFLIFVIADFISHVLILFINKKYKTNICSNQILNFLYIIYQNLFLCCSTLSFDIAYMIYYFKSLYQISQNVSYLI